MSDKEPEVLKTQLQYVERALMDKFKRGDDFFFIAPQSFMKIDDFFTKKLAKKFTPQFTVNRGYFSVAGGCV